MVAYEQDLGGEKEFQQSRERKAKTEFDVGIAQVINGWECRVESDGK